MMKKATALALALSMIIPMLSAAYAEDTTSKPEVTVVTKLIKDGATYDPNYLEISFEVNGDYKNYDTIGVVLEYDADVITPAADWDGTDGESAVMTENTTWATRRALPTLGNDMWKGHRASAYEVEETDNSSGTPVTKRTGYLYLGAEYPEAAKNISTPEPPASTADASTPSDPTAEPTAVPDDPYVNPIVVARFVYKNPKSDTNPDGMTPELFKAAWKLDNATDSWQKDWEKNEYITIAGDKIAEDSPAEYPFVYHYDKDQTADKNSTDKAFRHVWPSPIPTPDPNATPAPTVDPESTFAPYSPPPVGLEYVEDKPLLKLTKDDIEIVLGEGKSAKTTGGLKLSDVFAILFFDWDNTIIGSITAGRGTPMTESVNDYVKEKFIHPTLQEEDYSKLTATQLADREYNYRGKYPHISPSSGKTYPDTLPESLEKTDPNYPNVRGSSFPLTNKLEYCFAGKDIDFDYPYANGWTLVTAGSNDYSGYPGLWSKVLPRSMDDTWTSLSIDDKFERRPELNASGQVVDASGNVVSPQPTISDKPVYSYDFSNIEDDDLDGGVLYVKAVYTPGTFLDKKVNGVADSFYTVTNYLNIGCTGTVNNTDGNYPISFQYERINTDGNGVRRTKEPKIKMDVKQEGASGSFTMAVDLTNDEIIDVQLTPSRLVQTVTYFLTDVYGNTILGGSQSSAPNAHGTFSNKDSTRTGFIYRGSVDRLIRAAYNKNSNTTNTAYTQEWNNITMYVLNDLGLKPAKNSAATLTFNALTTNAAKTKLLNGIKAATESADYNGQIPLDLTFFQLEYMLCNNGAYVKDSVAKPWIESNCTWY